MNICGTDEAGRGPIIGPLVICGAMIEETELSALKKLGVKDSKLLSPSKREAIARVLPKYVKFHLILVSPQEIDEAVTSEETNLNWLEADKSVEILRALKPNKAILDCPSPNLTAYAKYVVEKLSDKQIEVRAEHKADVNHLIVGAASILAKVRRDTEIAKLREKIGEDFGSGYLGDPKTKSFLLKHWNTHADIFRQSWSPYQRLIDSAIS